MAIVIGLTGGIASGKSTVSSMFREKGFTVIDADVAAREVVNIGENAYNKIVQEFGKEILLDDLSLDRAKLGAIVFHNEEKRLLLNSIVHPAVREYMNDKKEKAIAEGKKTVILDIPLLFESKLTYMVDRTILIYVDADIQLMRLMERNGFTEEEAKARISAQLPLKNKIDLADVVIYNNGDLEETETQLNKLINSWNLTN
ncbi:dephospho-CoA kinase [Bacillus sp. FJAT-49736]|uniref:dephospho-CoA kinase n=1 Tax=Bacillus sp. FJAT-49736 TaxID=2833582 RepID=UPI001BC939A3|nr:dephospho-CoA kinase [Bacillus sp. FJAT-49736]MBS4173785.1 dephospho-CoA kinase [Bacillus sp. FJAT-49736]